MHERPIIINLKLNCTWCKDAEKVVILAGAVSLGLALITRLLPPSPAIHS
jgi:hypothetical protein